MWTIDPIDRVSADRLVAAAIEGRRAELASSLTRRSELLADRYDAYDAAQFTLRTFPIASTHDALLNDALSYLYKQMREDVRAELLSRHRGRSHRVTNCALCGIDTAGTLDHYLPQGPSHYPEFACYARNLVPCCATCNGLRGHHKWRNTINPYFDDIPSDEPGVKVRIEWSRNPPRVSIVAAPTSFGHRMDTHLLALNLHARVGEVASTRLGMWRTELRELGALGDVKATFLKTKKKTAVAWYGVHHWEAALADAAKTDLAEFSAFVDAA